MRDIITSRTDAIKKTLFAKNREYGRNDDAFHNFNVAARILNTTPEKALLGMMSKHLVSVLDIIELAETAPEKITSAFIDEKIGDSINYLILLEGMLKKRLEEKCKK